MCWGGEIGFPPRLAGRESDVKPDSDTHPE